VSDQESQEIGHSGGKVTFKVRMDADDSTTYQVEWTHRRPGRTAAFAVYAIPQGAALRDLDLKGMGVPWDAPPFPDCVPVPIVSDSDGMFGRRCSDCGGYLACKPHCQCVPVQLLAEYRRPE